MLLPFNFFWFKSIRHLFAKSKSSKITVAFCEFFSFILIESILSLYEDKKDLISDSVVFGGRSQKIKYVFCDEF